MLNMTTQTMIEVYLGYYLFSALVQSLPNPSVEGGVWYRSFYNFLTILVADFKSFTPKVDSGTPASVLQSLQTNASVSSNGKRAE